MGSNPAIPTKGTGVRLVAVLGAETSLGAAIAGGLSESGFEVIAVGDADPLPAGVSVVLDGGPLREPTDVGDLASLSAEGWVRTAEDPMRRALHVLQSAHKALQEGGGRVVVLLPSLVMTGAAGVASWAAAAEGYRSLSKAAARAWGSEGITVQCVLVPIEAVSASIADRPGLQPPALARTPDAATEIAPALAALLDQRLDVMTGMTVAVDGGVWMTA